MLFDLTLQPVGYSIAPEENEGGGVTIAMTVGIPMPGPNGQTAVLPMGHVKFPMQKGDALNLAASIAEEAEKIPDANKGQLVVTDQMPNVNAAEIERKLRGNA